MARFAAWERSPTAKVLVGLAPSPQFLATETRVGAQHDVHLGPPGAQLGHDALDFIRRTGPHHPHCWGEVEQLIAGEDLERQVTVVVAMKKSLRLMALERDVGGIQIEHDLVGRFGVRLEEQIAEQRVDLLRRVVDLVVTLRTARKLQPVQRTLVTR